MNETHRRPFITPHQDDDTRESPRGQLLFASCRNGHYLAQQVMQQYKNKLHAANWNGSVHYLPNVDYSFSDTETCVRLEEDISGRDVFLFQGLYSPTDQYTVDRLYMALMIAIRAFREWGAHKITVVAPYLAYARQDKPTQNQREPTTAKLMADLAIDAGLDRLVTWHPHSSQIRGFYGRIPVDMLDASVLFQDVFQEYRGRDDVIVVAPDAGISKFVVKYSHAMDLDYAIAFKYRPRQEDALISEIIGDFSSKRIAIVLDDMISSGGTMHSLVKTLVREHPQINEVYLGVSHNLCTEYALKRMHDLHENHRLTKLIVTDSIHQRDAFQTLPFIQIKSLSEVLASAVNSIHYNRTLGRPSVYGPDDASTDSSGATDA